VRSLVGFRPTKVFCLLGTRSTQIQQLRIAEHAICHGAQILAILARVSRRHLVAPEKIQLTVIHATLLQLADLEVRFRRSLSNLPAPAPPPIAARLVPPPMQIQPEVPSANTTSGASSYDDPEDDLTVVMVNAQKVGVLWRSRHVASKRVGKTPVVTQGSAVRQGQAIAFIEQLGTYSPVEVRSQAADVLKRCSDVRGLSRAAHLRAPVCNLLALIPDQQP
jgi:biotin carboxyl carrier protein